MNLQINDINLFSVFLPEGTLLWFDITESQKLNDCIKITLVEKNLKQNEIESNCKIESKGFKSITITDFPIRGRKALLTFKRRYWKIEGQEKLFKRNIKLNFEGTLLEQEFASFLKDGG